jgi:hypothetical protein
MPWYGKVPKEPLFPKRKVKKDTLFIAKYCDPDSGEIILHDNYTDAKDPEIIKDDKKE